MTGTLDRERELDDTFAALANATRRAMLMRLAVDGEVSVNELAEPFDLSLPAISKHLKVLERAGLVVRTRRAQYRPCRLDPKALEVASAWADEQRELWNGRLDQLETQLANLQGLPMTDHASDPTKSVVIERTFAAPRALVWSMFAESERFAGWYGPPGATIPVAEMDVVVGGKRKVCMQMETPDGAMTMWLVGEFVEIVEGERLVYTEMMGEADGSSDSPATQVIIELSDTDDGTRMVLTHVGVPEDSPGAMGWNMAIDKLTAQLA